MSAYEDLNTLRAMLGETIGTGETEADTLFTDAQLTVWIGATKNLEAAAVKGWRAKMASYAGLVDVVDGASQRKMSDLFDHAKQMIAYYTLASRGPAAGRTTVGKIVRSWIA